MKFPIDALFLDSSGRILKIYAEIKPWRISGIHFKAQSVLELAAGSAARAGLAVGDMLSFKESTGDV